MTKEEEIFIADAEWIDKNPKSPWISVNDDLPCNHEELKLCEKCTRKVLVMRHSVAHLEFMIFDEETNTWDWEFWDDITHWMPIPDLPK